MTLTKNQRDRIAAIFTKFLSDRVKTIRKLKIEDLNVNPFLVRLLANEMGFKDSKSIIQWLVNQRSMTGGNTSFGFALQTIARLFSEGTGVEGADIMKSKHGRHYHIQVKSGPATMDKDAVTQISRLLVSAQRRNQGSVALIGMCYGNRNQVFSTVKLYSNVEWKIGREFWEFVSDDSNCMQEIYEIADHVGKTFKDAEGKVLSEVIEGKVEELQHEFERLYGKSGKSMWDKLLQKNS